MPSTLVLAFGLVLMVAVLISERANHSILSTSVVFLVAGFVVGRGAFGWVNISPNDNVIGRFAEVALFTILFVDGAQLSVRELTKAWRLPGRALLLGMPLTLGGIAVAGHWLLGISWPEAFLVGAILSPTDPVFVSAILESETVPIRLRRLLGVESGMNDGIALPIVMVLLAVAGHRDVHPMRPILEAGLGLVIGVLVPVCLLLLESHRVFAASRQYEPLAGVAIAAVIFGLSRTVSANEFLAAYAGGVTLASMRPRFASASRQIGVPIAEAVKLGTLLIFGAMLSLPFLLSTGLRGAAFAVAALVAARPLALVFALLGGGLTRKEWFAAAWFGPKGFSSLLYALLLVQAQLARWEWLFQAIAIVIIVSIIAHSSTDVTVARVFAQGSKSSS